MAEVCRCQSHASDQRRQKRGTYDAELYAKAPAEIVPGSHALWEGDSSWSAPTAGGGHPGGGQGVRRDHRKKGEKEGKSK